MTIKLNAATGGGSVSLSAPNSTTSNLDVELTLPVDDGAANTFLKSDGSGTLSWASASSDNITEGNTTVECVDSGSDGHITFDTEGSERGRFNSSGRFLVGTTSNTGFIPPGETFTTSAVVQISGVSNTGASAFQATDTMNGDVGLGGSIFLTKRSSNDSGVGNGHALGAILFSGWDTAALRVGAMVQAEADGDTWASGDCPTRLLFHTTADGASSPTERMRISNNGSVEIFNSTSTTLGVMSALSAGTSDNFIIGLSSRTALGSGGSTQFVVRTNGNVLNTNNSYGSISDIKLKENIVDASSQWNDLKAIQVRNYNFKEETGHQTHTQLGVIAQEVELVSPGLVTESPDREDVQVPVLDSDGNAVLDGNGDQVFTTETRDLGTTTKSVNYSVLYMKAVKALQEAMERIETLETANASLEARLTALEGGAS